MKAFKFWYTQFERIRKIVFPFILLAISVFGSTMTKYFLFLTFFRLHNIRIFVKFDEQVIINKPTSVFQRENSVLLDGPSRQ
jgi:hypothetical protein